MRNRDTDSENATGFAVTASIHLVSRPSRVMPPRTTRAQERMRQNSLRDQLDDAVIVEPYRRGDLVDREPETVCVLDALGESQLTVVELAVDLGHHLRLFLELVDRRLAPALHIPQDATRGRPGRRTPWKEWVCRRRNRVRGETVMSSTEFALCLYG